ncbi:MAG: nucleoside triphosphate pyrophosphohydrolase [Mariprofundaceae bacterium]
MSDIKHILNDINPNGYNKLYEIMEVLRERCPWDRAQDFGSLRKHLIEECHEVLDAIEAAELRGEWDGLRDELGDLLFQILFHARLAEEAGQFDFEDVADALIEKMIRRHPHVFAGDTSRGIQHDEARWEAAKAAEYSERKSLMDGIPPLPALAHAQKLQQRAARVGFDWPDALDVLDKIQEEIAELAHEIKARRKDAMEDEFGDVLFALVNLGRKLGIDAEPALMRSNRKFIRRFRAMERIASSRGVDLDSLSDEELESIYREAKLAETRQGARRP